MIVIRYESGKHTNIHKATTASAEFGDFYYDSLTEISNSSLSAQQCYNDVCIKNVSIKCTSTYGNVYYTITNTSTSLKSNIYLLLKFGGDKFVGISYSALTGSASVSSHVYYEGYDLTGVSSYELVNVNGTPDSYFGDYK